MSTQQPLYAKNGAGDGMPQQGKRPYFPDRALVKAVNSALLLGKPLLVTGEPGCGKTQLAFSVAHDLGLSEPLRFDTKSISEATNLFYHYDAVGHFRAAQIQGGKGSDDPRPHIEVQALGKAILRANPPKEELRTLLREKTDWVPARSVVLIDEVDKAPRDFPNDLLNELENFSFRIPELPEPNEFSIPEAENGGSTTELRPIVIITSNSEKNLPEAFLRRCVYHDIPFPRAPKPGEEGPDRLKDIVLAHVRVDGSGEPPWLADALDFFRFTRESWGGRLQKQPGTAELIDLANLLAGQELSGSLKEAKDHLTVLKDVLGSVFKIREDRSHGERIVDEWAASA